MERENKLLTTYSYREMYLKNEETSALIDLMLLEEALIFKIAIKLTRSIKAIFHSCELMKRCAILFYL